MLRIDVKWDFVSPMLRVALGTLSVNDINYNGCNYSYKTSDPVLECKVKIESHSIGFKSISDKGFSTEIFNLLKPKVGVLLNSFFDGLVLNQQSHLWLDDITCEEAIKNVTSEEKTFVDETATKIKTNDNWDPHIIKVGVCGICNTEHKTYRDAVNCCSNLKGEDYCGKINKVFEMRQANKT